MMKRMIAAGLAAIAVAVWAGAASAQRFSRAAGHPDRPLAGRRHHRRGDAGAGHGERKAPRAVRW